MNAERGARGLAPLSLEPDARQLRARRGARRWARSNLHHSDIGQLLGPFDYVGENIAMGSAGVSAGALHVAWMHSQEHRDNILSPGYQEVGIGVYCAPNGSIWATTEFARPTSSGPAAGGYNGGTPQNPVARPDGDSLTCGRLKPRSTPTAAPAPATASAITTRDARGRNVEREEVPHAGNRERADERAGHRGEQHARAAA